MASTRAVRTDNSEAKLDEAIAEIYEGVADVFSDPGNETVPIEFEGFDEPMKLLEDGKVLLTNIYHADEDIYIPEADGKTWSGRKASFNGHRLVTDSETAQVVKAACPYVYQEDPNGHWLKHNESGFTTSNPLAWQTYVERYNANK